MSTGRGATAAALARRATRRLSFLPACFVPVRIVFPSLFQTSPRRSGNEPGRSGTGRASANPCGNLGGNGSVSLSSSGRSGCLSSSGGILLTVVGDLLIVLDRLDAEFSSAHAQKWGDGGIVSAGAGAAAALTIVTVVDQAPLDCRLEITGRREGGCNLEVSAWKGDWPKFLEGLDNPMSVVGNFDSPADCAGGAPHNLSTSSCGQSGGAG